LEQLTNKRIHDIFDKEQADFFVAQIRRALQEGPIEVDYSLRINDRTIWFSASVSPLTDTSVIWVARDITERKALEEMLEARVAQRTDDLRKSEERFRSVFDQARDIIFTLSHEGIITSLN